MLFSRKHRWIALLDQRGFRGAVINLTRVNIFVLAPRVALTLGVLLFVLIVFTDYVSSYELSLTPFYLFVVLLVTWNCGTTSQERAGRGNDRESLAGHIQRRSGIFNSVLASEDAMISFTDKLMYRVKSAGKNNVSIEVFEAAA